MSRIRALLFVAFRYLFGISSKGGGRYLLGAAAGIALSLIPIMVTLVVTDGMIRGITDRFLELGTGHIQVRAFGPAFGEGLDSGFAVPIVSGRTGVRGIWNEIQGIGIIVGRNGKTGATIRAVDPSFWEDEGGRRYLNVIDGEGAISEASDVLLGSELAADIGAEVGKTIRIMTVRTSDSGRNIPRAMAFKVRGIVSAGYHEIDSMWCLTGFETGRRLLEGPANKPFLVIKVDDPYTRVDEIAAELNEEFSGFFHAYTWKQIQPLQYGSYEQTRQILLFIMALIVLVAAVNVSSAVSMLAIERRRDIAVLKAFGTDSVNTTLIFLFGGSLTGFFGAVFGICAGLFFGININELIRGLESFLNLRTAVFNAKEIKILDPGFYLETIPIIIHKGTVAGIGIFTFFCAIISSALPALRAGRAKPAELIRNH